MVNPIHNEGFQHDFAKFVYQIPDVIIVPQAIIPKPFSIKPSKKAKKDIKKEKSPWSPQKPNQDSTNPT
jgi:hypothetical protein